MVEDKPTPGWDRDEAIRDILDRYDETFRNLATGDGPIDPLGGPALYRWAKDYVPDFYGTHWDAFTRRFFGPPEPLPVWERLRAAWRGMVNGLRYGSRWY